MPPTDAPSYHFTISGLPDDSFQVVKFTGTEGLSQLYEFDVLLASASHEIDLGAVLSGRTRLSVHRPGKQELGLNGMVLDFDQLEQNHGLTFYRALVVPRAWWLTQIRTTQIFLDDEMHHVLESILKQAALQPGLDFEFRLAANYPKRDWICQYDETHWNFFNRLMERAGLYFFFEQTQNGEKLVVTDTAMSHVPLTGEGGLSYRPPSALDTQLDPETARSFRCALHRLPKEVLIRDYNYRTLRQVEGRHEVSETGLGTIYRHVEDLRSNSEANYVAKARADGLACQGRRFHGETAAPFLRPGFTFHLSDHYRSDFNREYTTIELKHEGHQEAYIATLAGQNTKAAQDKPFYRNTFVAIPSDVQFRPEPKTPRPIVAGPVTAWIDGEAEGKYAEVDSMGRYKVVFPLDLSGRNEGKASHWIRMMTPYGGNGHGMHFPLHKGTEVLVVFRDGNPDKPVIAGAVPNMTQKMVVNEDNNTQCRLTTAGDNRFHIEDLEGSQRFLLHTPVENSWVRIGAPNDPPATSSDSDWNWNNAASKNGIAISTGNSFSVNCQVWNTVTFGESSSFTGGMKMATVLGETLNISLGPRHDIVIPRKYDYTPSKTGIESMCEYLHIKKKVVVAQQEQIAEQQQIIIEQNNVVIQEQNNIVQEQNNVVEDHNDMNVQHEQVVVEQNLNAVQQEQAIVNQNNQIVEQEQVIANQNIQAVEQNIMVEQQNNMVVNGMSLGAMKQMLFGGVDII
ncbi:MAG: type VI secretion system tip protein VgrG [Desulfovibrio sp.]|nr:type VI secretion system tip protein VgrG [Desulfovibrio sp.]